MQTYNLARIAGPKTRKESVTLSPVSNSIGAERDYLKALRVMLRGMAKTVREEILPEAEREIERQRATLTQDAWGAWVFDRLREIAASLSGTAESMVRRILSLEADRHTDKWKASVRSALGIDIGAVITQEDLAEFMETAAARNASLIKSLSDEMVKRVERATYDAILQGKTATQLRKDLTEQFGIADSRAKLIARDQTAKLTSDLNRVRHQQAGIKSYIWTTSHDERVRERHRRLDGNEYEYGKSTGAEQGLPPGQPIQCRCVARAVVYFGEERFSPS